MTHFLSIYLYYCIGINVQKNTFEKLNNPGWLLKSLYYQLPMHLMIMRAWWRWRLGLLTRCIARFMDKEGFETAGHLALAHKSHVKATIDNVNKLFGSTTGNNRIYFPPIKVARIKALCVYFRRCLMINQIPDICLIDLARCQVIVITIGLRNRMIQLMLSNKRIC